MLAVRPGKGRHLQKGLRRFRHLRQHRLQINHQLTESIDAHAGNALHTGARGLILDFHPRLLRINIFIGQIGEMHDFAHRRAVFALLIAVRQHLALVGKGLEQFHVRQFVCQPAVKMFVQKRCAAAGKIDQLADQIAIHL